MQRYQRSRDLLFDLQRGVVAPIANCAKRAFPLHR